MALKVREFEAKLQNKFGFSPSKSRSSDHRWYELEIPGLPAITTKISHGHSEISDTLEGMIARQLRVRRKFFAEMFACTKDKSAYIDQVRRDPYPPFSIGFD